MSLKIAGGFDKIRPIVMQEVCDESGRDSIDQ